jgi:NADPH:quinone reductase-like Zn-dependent oxidoreductase
VIDYTKEDFSRGALTYDLILDNAAFGSLLKPVGALKPTGTYVLIGGSIANFLKMTILGPLISRKHGRKVTGLMAKIAHSDLDYLSALMAAGKIQSIIDRTYPLSKVADAIRYVEAGHTRGKVIITIP